ncbi:hypothetical protein LZ009_12445 [Ramlibacter sp. XY19]|uniref:hypothetical protein n=1 Tax=Ramlibacter paludis TaxID=2908000 RepID=UPI0023DA08A0|nr:hypothetical protein [Ramlibacter paludis]MCG2593588.1 hypothetical protein [Ramlibacter paludis]
MNTRALAAAAAIVMTFALAACGGGGADPSSSSGTAPVDAPSPAPALQTLFTLATAQTAASPRGAAMASGDPQPAAGSTTLIAGLLDENSQSGIYDFSYDAYVVTALRSESVTVTSTVLTGKYLRGYGFPISIGVIEAGADLRAWGNFYVQDALQDGIAVTKYPVEKDRQYILVYKTFSNFMPQGYTLEVGDALRVEGLIDKQGEVTDLPADPGGPISVANPRPRALSRLIGQIAPVLR